MPPRTIDNLGLDASSRYAEDKQYLDEKIVKESRTVSTQTEIDVTLPSFPRELDLLFEMQKCNVFWAAFAPPAKYAEQKKRLFTHQIIPSLGSEDKKERLLQKIRSKIQAKKEREEKDEKRYQWEEQREREEEEKERNMLVALVECIAGLEKVLVEINSRRRQYQKG
jgi:hypothetical protein